MNKVLKKAAVLLTAMLVLVAALPAAKVSAKDSAPLHTAVTVSGKVDNQTVTYTAKLDKTTVSDGRVAVLYDTNVLTLKKNTQGIRFTESDVNKNFEESDQKGIAYAFVNDSAKSVSGTLISLTFNVKKNLDGQDTVIKTVVYGLNNEDAEVVAASTLEDAVTVGREKLKKPQLNSLDQTIIGVNVRWTKDKNADGYVVYRSTSKNGKYTAIATVNSGNYWDILIQNNKTYYYKIKSYQKKGSERVYSEESNVLSIKVKKFFGIFG